MNSIPRKKIGMSCGVKRRRKLTGVKLKRDAEIQQLFDDMKQVYELESLAIFRKAAETLHDQFLKNVRLCPWFVLKFIRQKLRPEALLLEHRKKEGERQEKLKKAEELAESLRHAVPH